MIPYELNPGHKVYVIYGNSISLKSALYIGEYSFIVGGYEWLTEDAREWNYGDYGKTWFTSIADAKEYLLQENLANGRIGKIVRIATDYWEFRED